MQCEKYTQAAFMTLSPDNIFRITDRNLLYRKDSLDDKLWVSVPVSTPNALAKAEKLKAYLVDNTRTLI